MTVNVCLPLFGDPGRELEEGARGRDLRQLGEQLRERLAKAADILDKLHVAGWSSQVAAFDVILTPVRADTREEAERQLREAGVDPEELMIVEEPEQDEAE
jgi:hypothetical protein